jgi:hypothetical protein
MYETCVKSLDIEMPSYANVNRLISQVASSMTTPLRFEGLLNMEISEMQSNLVKVPELKFMICSYAPITAVQKEYREQPTVAEVPSVVATLFIVSSLPNFLMLGVHWPKRPSAWHVHGISLVPLWIDSTGLLLDVSWRRSSQGGQRGHRNNEEKSNYPIC